MFHGLGEFSFSSIVAAAAVLFIFSEILWPYSQRSLQTHLRSTLFNLFFGLVSLLLAQKVVAEIPLPSSGVQFDIPFWSEVFLCLLVLDGLSWAWHWCNHHVNFLWKSHQVHHSDKYLSTLSSIRFHPFELIPGLLLRNSIGALLGFSTEALILFQFIYALMNLWEHSNIKVPARLSKILEWVLITPRIHHLHHSTHAHDQRKNLGTIFSFWDRCFGTLSAPHHPSAYGICENQKTISMVQLWILPIKKGTVPHDASSQNL